MDGQLIVIVKIHARWALEIIIIEIQSGLRLVIWEFIVITSIIGDNRLGCSFKYNTLFLPSYGKNYTTK